MRVVQQEEKQESLYSRLTRFLLNIKGLLWIILGLLIAGFIAYFIFSEVRGRKRESSTTLVEQAQEKYEEWRSEEDEDKKADQEKKLMEDLEAIVDRFPRTYASQRALSVRGDIFFEKGDWELAEKDYKELSERFAGSYLAPEAVLKRAICMEELEDVDEALALYRFLADNYPDSPRLPQAYFSIGRLFETKGDFDEALSAYNHMKLEYPYSNWTNLGINRIIHLKSTGKVEE